VISVGNLRAGGSGKTPVVAHLARLLLSRGERPVILTRGYARRRPSRGVTVVSDGLDVRASLDEAGDEPLMLARALPGVPVLVGADRHRSGRFAEAQLGATVHLLDDGFQHLMLARDVDLLVAAEDDLRDRVLPAGRLREPVAAAAAADALLSEAGAEVLERLRRGLGVPAAFRMVRTIEAPRALGGDQLPAPGAPVFAVAGIARPERFMRDLAAGGWRVAGSLLFRDHHAFTAADVARIEAAAGAAGAAAIVTTEKDAVRLEGCKPRGLQVMAVPLRVTVEPAADFAAWLMARIRR
jgi:tetraacyldisaccharide 4'-kinase